MSPDEFLAWHQKRHAARRRSERRFRLLLAAIIGGLLVGYGMMMWAVTHP